MKIIKFKTNLSHYLNLIDARKSKGDLWGVLEATKSAFEKAKTKTEKSSLGLLFAQCYCDMKQYLQSNFWFFKVATIPHLKASAFFGIGQNLALSNHFELALSYFELALCFDCFSIFSEPILSWTQKIKAELEKPETEIKSLKQKSKFLMLGGNFSQASKILGSLKTDDEVLCLLAMCNLNQNDFSTAEILAKQVLQQNENCVLANLVLFETNKKKGKAHLNKNLSKKLENLMPNSADDLLRLGMFFSRQKNFFVAKKFFEKLLSVDEFSAKNHLFLALCQKNLKQNDDAFFSICNACLLDFENPIYQFFYDLFKTEDFEFEVVAKLPKQIEQQKVNDLLEIFFSGNFDQTLSKSHTLLFDLEWCFSLNDFAISNKASQALCFSKNKNCKLLLKKLLIMPSNQTKQKYLIIKNALLSENFFEFNLVCNMHFSSFCVTKNDLKNFNQKFKKAVCKAISFAECFFPEERLLCKILKTAKKEQNNAFLKNLNSSLVACFLLFAFPKVFEKACVFFQTEKNFVCNLIQSSKTN